jgi:hypothetical protein
MIQNWLKVGLAVGLCLLGFAEVLRPSPVSAQAEAACTYYVNNQSAAGGNGSITAPWNTISGSLSKLSPGQVLCVRGDTSGAGRLYTETALSVDGINGKRNGTAQAPIVVRTYPGERVILRSSGSDDVLEFRDISHWQFDGFILDGQASRRIGAKFTRANFNVIRNCEIRDVREDGVNLYLSYNNLIENCRIYRVDNGPYKDGTGIILNGSNNTVIRGNILYDLKGDGVQIYNGFGEVSATLIEQNHFYTTLGICSENAVDVKIGGAQPTRIRDNRMHGFRPNDGACGGSGGGLGEAIIVHEDGANVVIERNEIYDSAAGITVSGKNVWVVNNLIHGLVRDPRGWAGIGLYLHMASDIDVRHNTFVNLPDTALWLGGNVYNLRMHNNLFYNAGRVQRDGDNSVIASHNGWFAMAGRLPGPSDVLGNDPAFLGAGNYRLLTTSPAVDAGTAAYSADGDFDRAPRPMGLAPDLGAFEVQGPPPVTSLRVVRGVVGSGTVTLTLTWIEPGRPGQPSPVHHHELRYANQVITNEVWPQATVLVDVLSPGSPGERRSLQVTVPYSGSGSLYLGLRSIDAASRLSPVSNPAFWPFTDVFLPVVRR